MGMASAYGVLLGLVRRASGGLMAPIGVHIVADAVILGILLTR
jgi:membrane protease YdiL (CAAX protease family)